MALIWLFAGFVNGLTGMGGALIAVPLLSLFLDIQVIIPYTCIIVTYICVLVTYKFRNHINFNDIKPLVLSGIPGAILGTVFLIFISPIILQIVMAVFLICYVLWSLLRDKNKSSNLKISINSLMCFCGFFSGFAGSSISFSGPPLAIFIIYSKWETIRSLATLTATAVFISIIICLTHAVSGLYNATIFLYVLVTIPSVTIGTILAFPVVSRISPEKFRNILLIIIGISGFLASIKAIMSF